MPQRPASGELQSNYSPLELAALLMSLVPANRQAHHIGKMLKDMVAQGDLEAALRGERDLTPGQLLALAQLVLAHYKPDNGSGSILALAAQITLTAHQALTEELFRLQARLAAAEGGGARRARTTRTRPGTGRPSGLTN